MSDLLIKAKKDSAPDVIPGQAAYSHNMFYRGKDLTDYTNDELHEMVSSGTFRDIYPGDYFDRTMGAFSASATGSDNQSVTFTRSQGTVRFYVAHLNYLNHTGNTDFGNVNHAILIANIGSSKMNATNTTGTGYPSCALAKILNSDTVVNAFKGSLGSNYVKTGWKDLLPNSVGTVRGETKANGWDWVTQNIRLLNEQAVYGKREWSSQFDSGILRDQFAIFRGNKYVVGRVDWWLSSVYMSTDFCMVHGDGSANAGSASNSRVVVPLCVFI